MLSLVLLAEVADLICTDEENVISTAPELLQRIDTHNNIFSYHQSVIAFNSIFVLPLRKQTSEAI